MPSTAFWVTDVVPNLKTVVWLGLSLVRVVCGFVHNLTLSFAHVTSTDVVSCLSERGWGLSLEGVGVEPGGGGLTRLCTKRKLFYQ